jgi:hypothetical protein
MKPWMTFALAALQLVIGAALLLWGAKDTATIAIAGGLLGGGGVTTAGMGLRRKQ